MTRDFRKTGIWLLEAVIWLCMSQAVVSAQDINVAVIDSGARGYVDSAVSFTSYPANSDPLNHGTEIAKLIRQGNPTVKIHMLQVCEKKNGTLRPSRSAILQAIKWCIEHEINIVNMSLVTKYDKDIEDAITNAATSHGILFIAAAGNKTLASRFAADADGYVRKISTDIKPAFPASNKDVIAVGGLEPNGKIAAYSDKTCDVYANGRIFGQEGSSFACARITSKAAQLLSYHPAAAKEAILSYLKE